MTAKTSSVAGEFRIAWTVQSDYDETIAQKKSAIKQNGLYRAPTEYDLNGLEGDPTIIKKTTTSTGKGPKVIATTNGLGATEKSLFPNNPQMAKEALKMKYKPGPVLADMLSVSNPRENPTGTKGIFFGTVAIVAEERFVPGDAVMVDMSDPEKPAKSYGKGREGTSRNTRRPLIFVKYTPMIPTKALLEHVHSSLNTPVFYKQLSSTTPKTAMAYTNAVNALFSDDMFLVALATFNMSSIFMPRPSATELHDENGNELSAEEISIRVAQYLHAIPLDRERAQKRDASVNGRKVWEEIRYKTLKMKYYDRQNKAYEFGFKKNGQQLESSAVDLKTNKVKNTAAGNMLKQQYNSAVRRIASTYMAADFSKLWKRGVIIVGAKPGDTAVLLVK